MQTVLFHDTIFGPIHSRRLGTSLGINLMPNDGKICSFDCLYCEAGYNAQGPGTTGLPSRDDVARQLDQRLAQMKADSQPLDVITFSGNGEPTLHPDFPAIIDDTIALRDRYFPNVKISVLTNATRIADPAVADALKRVDNNILKLDSAIPETVAMLDRPAPGYDVRRTIDLLEQFRGTGIIQTMFTAGTHNGKPVDNTTDAEIDALIDAYRRIAPRQIMIYTIDRATPEESLRHISPDRLSQIADRITAATSLPIQLTT